MRHFNYVKVNSVEEASALLIQGKSRVMSGGTDLIGALKDEIDEKYPETVIGIKDIPGLHSIEETESTLDIGAMTTLAEIAASDAVKENCPSLAAAAYSVATPSIRNAATLGGNVCQDTRCWYYRYPDNIGGKFDCARKGGKLCYALLGENRYHSIFGAMKCGLTPCSSECPAGTDIPGYMDKLRAGDWDGAAEIIMRFNPMPMITSRICPHPCQSQCNHKQNGESVSIHCVERTLGDYILEHMEKFYKRPECTTGKKAAIVGAGPGGLTCAYFLRKQGHEVTVYDRMEKPGGVLRYGIPHYRLPKSILDQLIIALEQMGIVFQMNTAVGSDITMEQLKAENDCVYLGTGAWKQPVIGLQGESLTQFGLDFLVDVNTYLKKAIGNHVLVCGGGNVAMDVALTACRLGAKSVQLVCLEGRDEMPASSEEIAMAEEEGVKIYNGWGLKRVTTDENGTVSGLEAVKCISVRDETGRFQPIYDENETMQIASDYIILATGQRVDVEFLGEKFASQLKSARGLINVEDAESYKTKMEGIYAGGDAVTGPNIAIRAIRAGNRAAHAMSNEMGKKIIYESEKKEFLSFDLSGAKRENGAVQKLTPVLERTLVKENESSLSKSEAVCEAARCMNCGCLAVCPSDTAPVLIAAGASVITNMRKMKAEELFAKTKIHSVLLPGEIVVGFEIPKKSANTVMNYDKFRLREAIDFAIVGLATSYEVENGVITDAKIVLGSCAPIPIRAKAAEAYLVGKTITKEAAKEAAELALIGAIALECNEYKIDIAKTLVKRSIERLGQ